MALDTEGRKLLPRGAPDPPGFSEPVPSKIKTSDLTESQLVREGLKLDEYLRRWREVELPETPRTRKGRDSYVKRAFALMHRYQDITGEFEERRTQRRLYAQGRPAGPGEVLFGELMPGDRILVEVQGVEGPVSCTVRSRSSEGYSVVGLDTTEGYHYKNRYMPVARADVTQINDLRDDHRSWNGDREEEYGLLVRWLERRPQSGAEGRDGVHARAAHLHNLLTSDPTFEGTLVPLPAPATDEQLDLFGAQTAVASSTPAGEKLSESNDREQTESAPADPASQPATPSQPRDGRGHSETPQTVTPDSGATASPKPAGAVGTPTGFSRPSPHAHHPVGKERDASTVDGRPIPTAKEMEQYESGDNRVVNSEGERALFGSPERMRALAAEGFVPRPAMRSDDDEQVWRRGRLIGGLSQPHGYENTLSGHDTSAVWWSKEPFSSATTAFSTKEAAIAHLVLCDEERGEPDLSIVHPDLAWDLDTSRAHALPGPGLSGLESLQESPSDMERYRAVTDLVSALGRGESPSGNVADDLDRLHDELRWLENTHYREQEPQSGQGHIHGPGWLADTVREYLDVLRPEDPRAMHHEARRNRAGHQYLEGVLANSGKENAEHVAPRHIRAGDVVHLSGRVSGRYPGATGRQTGFVNGEPRKVRLTVDGKKQTAWRITVGPDQGEGTRQSVDTQTFSIPDGDSCLRLVQARDVHLPVDHQSYGRRAAPEQAGNDTPSRAPETAPPPSPDRADRQDPSAAPGDDRSNGPDAASRDNDHLEGTQVVTPNGSGEVMTVHGDSVLVRGAQSTLVYPLSMVKRPDGSPLVVDPEAEKVRRNAEALAQAATHQGVKLADAERWLRDLDVQAGHGFVVDSDGRTVGWVRARIGDDGRRYWWGQDADGGAPEDMQWHEEMPTRAGAPPVRAATALRYGPEGSGVKDTIVTGPDGRREFVPEQRRLITPDRAITEMTLTQAQVRELGKLSLSGEYTDGTPIDTLPWDPGHRRYSPYSAQAGALAAAAREAAAQKSDLRVKKVLLGAARKMEFQQYDSARRAATIPPPGEPDPYSGPYEPNPVDAPHSPAPESPAVWSATIAAAASSEGLALERGDGPPDRLRDLDLKAGHGTLVDSEGAVIGWIRARWDGQRSRRTWWSQPAAGGKPGGFNMLSDDDQTALLTARTLQRDLNRIPTKGLAPQRSIPVDFASGRLSFTSQEVAALQGLQLTGTHSDGEPVPPPTWAEPADTHVRMVGQTQTQLNRYDLTVGQQQALAGAARSAAERTREGQEALHQLLHGVASRLDAEAYETGLHGATLPVPGEPDPYAEYFDPRRINETTDTRPGSGRGPESQNREAERRAAGNPAPGEEGQPLGEPIIGDAEPSGDLNPVTQPGDAHVPAAPKTAPDEHARPQVSHTPQAQLEFGEAPGPGDQATKEEEGTSSAHESQAALPPNSRERHGALASIARGTISIVDGVFFLTNPRRPTRTAPAQSHLRTALREGLAYEAGGQIHLSNRGIEWFTHHKHKLPGVPRDVRTVEQAPLPPTDYTPLDVLPEPQEQQDGLRPPAPAPLRNNWYRRAANRDEEGIQATLAMAQDAAERAAQSTARDVADLAAGPDHGLWTLQHPLAQYDENAAAALEGVTDPRTHDYATRAVLLLRAALEEAGHQATEHYVQNVRSPEWRTVMGRQSDDIHRDRIRGIVVTYLIELRTHATEHELDADTIIHVLEDAAGWAGDLRPLGLKEVEYPQLPAAENVAEAAQYVANSLCFYARGETDTVDIHAERRETWRPVGPRPVPGAPASSDNRQERARGLLAGDETPPGPDASADAKARFNRRFDLNYQVGQFVDHTSVDGETLTARVVTDGSNPVLRDAAGHEFRPAPAYRRSNFTRVLADDGSDLPGPAWTASLPAGQRAVPPSAVKPGHVIHDYRENGRQWSSRLVIDVKERDGVTALTCVGLKKFSREWVYYDHRTTAVLDETQQSRLLAEEALKGEQVRAFAQAFGISLTDIRVPPADVPNASTSPQKANAHSEQSSAEPQSPVSADRPADDSGPVDEGTEVAASARSMPGTGSQSAVRHELPQGRPAPDQNDARTRELEQTTGSPAPQDQTPAVPASAPAAQGQANDHSAPDWGDGGTGEVVDAHETGTGARIPADRPEPVPADSRIIPPPAPAAVREEGTVATSTPTSGAATAKPPVIPSSTKPSDQPPLQPATAYPDAAAYAAGHEELLAELDQHEPWLADTPAAAEAAATLTGDSTPGPEILTALLALQKTLPPAEAEQRPHLVEQLGLHVLRTQLAMTQRFFDQAAHSTHTDELRKLHRMAFQGGFIAFHSQTEKGELELGQYLKYRDQQITQQDASAESRAEEEAPATADEATTVDADPDDDTQLPVFERPGESVMVAEAAAPRLLAQAQAYLAAGGGPNAEPLAYIHGRQVYAHVDQPGTPAASLMLGLTLVDEEGSARAVTIPGDQLTVVAPETLLMAVTAWLNANDAGNRPLLDYAPSAATQPPAPHLSPEQAVPAELEEPTLAPAPAAPAPAPAPAPTIAATPAPSSGETATPRNIQGSAEPPAPSEPPAAPEPVAAAPAPETAPPGTQKTFPPPESNAVEAQAAPSSTDPPPARPEADAGSESASPQQDGTPRREGAPTEQSAPTEADRVGQITALARSVLTELGTTVGATGALTAPRTVLITLESSGNSGRDGEVAGYLRTALREAIRQHPDQGLATYRVDFQHTPQAGQGSLGDAPGTDVAPVPRERLIAANNAAAKVFAERLRDDPNAALARTYLTEKRQIPPEEQQKWILGYAPSDRGVGRWDLLVRALRIEGFTDDELLHAGLAVRSSRGTLIDYFDDRIMLPVHDEHGDIVGFQGRCVDRPDETEEQAKNRQSRKYFNTSNKAVLFNKGELVFGQYHPAQAQALAGSNGPRISVEGPFDVIAIARAAVTVPIEQRPVAGAPMGNDISERQLTVLRGLDTDNPRPHIAFLDAGESGSKVLLSKSNLLLRAPGPTMVTSAPGAKDAAELWEDGIKADGDGATPVLRALEQGQPLLDATVEAVLFKNADATERANHAVGSVTFFPQTRAIAREAARYIHESVQLQAPGDISALKVAALTWAKRLHQEWNIPGRMTATAVLLGPGDHSQDYEIEVYEQALDLLAADPEGYFVNDSHVRSRRSAEDTPAASTLPDGTGTQPRPKAGGTRPGQWPAGSRESAPVSSTGPTTKPGPAPEALALSLVLPSLVNGQPVEYTDRTTAAVALHTAVNERLSQHTAEIPEPDRLPQPLNLGTIHGIDLGTSGDDQTSDDPTIVLWLGRTRTDFLRLPHSRVADMTGPELLAAVEWRAAQAAGRLGTSLSPAWRNAVRSILPKALRAQPTPEQFANLLSTIAHGPDAGDERVRHRAGQAVSLYTAGHPDLALSHLASPDHIWVLRNDGSWIQEEATGTELSTEKLETGFAKESAELADITRAAGELPPAEPLPMAADLTVAHHSAHEALEAMRPYSIGLPGTLYEKITDLVAQMDGAEPALRRLRGPGGEKLMNRARTSFVRILEGLATVASKIRLTGLSSRLERTVARLRGQAPSELPAARVVRTDRRMQDLAHIERDLERRMAGPLVKGPVKERVAARLQQEPAADAEREQEIWTQERGRELDERGKLQEQWIINRARWRARYEQLTGQPPESDFLPDNGLIAGAPPVPNPIASHRLLLHRLGARVAELRDTDPHTGEDSNPYDPTADLLNGVAWAYQQRLVGFVPSGDDPQGPIPAAQLRQAALTVTTHQQASPLTLRRAMNVTAERADRLLHRLEEQQILSPYRADAPRAVLARPADIDVLLARPATPAGLGKPAADPAPSDLGSDPLAEARIRSMVSKVLAEGQKRSPAAGEPDPAQRPAPRVRKSVRGEAEANARASGPSHSLAPSQS
ncbi:hypothetical protein ACFWGI_06415 [Streptomyces niveus]|uniref:hypothetical protein n=1 Tax=Streptomyces niveus TaxID=193462 RepID=UPI00364C8235